MASNKLIRFENCRILRNGEIVEEDYLLVRNGKICDYMKIFFEERIEPDVRINCRGALLSPGLIDIQVNGAFGHDFSFSVDNVEEGLNKVAEGLLQYGVTGFCPTLVSSAPDVYRKVLPKMGSTTGSINLGVHVEGPFVNKSRVGAHAMENLQTFKEGIKSAEDIYGSLNKIKIITLAPEIEGALDTIKPLTSRGIIVSMGHSNTDLNIAKLAMKNGASLITHIFNAMTPFHHRDPGLLGLLTTKQEDKKPVYYGLISDGCHTHPEAVRIVYRTNYEGLILVTDAIAAMGLAQGIHRLGTYEIEIKDNCAYLLGTKTLCGSILPLNKCVQQFDEFTKCGKVKALEAATLHPAQVLGIANRKGTLNPGADADITIFNDKLDVLSTWIGGCCVYKQDINAFDLIN